METLSTKLSNGKFSRVFPPSITNHSFEKPAVTFERFSLPVLYSLFLSIIVIAMKTPFDFRVFRGYVRSGGSVICSKQRVKTQNQ